MRLLCEEARGTRHWGDQQNHVRHTDLLRKDYFHIVRLLFKNLLRHHALLDVIVIFELPELVSKTKMQS